MAGREGDGADRLPERSRRAGLKAARERVPSSAPGLDDVARRLRLGADAPGAVGPEALREAITLPRMGEPA